MKKLLIILLLGIFIINFSSAALTNNILAYYKLDDNLATTNVIDSLNLNNGTLMGGNNTEDLSVPGNVNLALDFNGIDDGVNLTTLIIDKDEDFSISVWVNPDQLTASDNTILSKDSTFLFDFNDETEIRLRMTSSGTELNYPITEGNFTGVWTHLVIIVNSTISILYVNGSQVQTGPGNALIEDVVMLNIGQRNDGSASFDGKIDEVGIWNRTLTSSEITELYNSGNGITYPFPNIGVNLISPENGSLLSTTDINFTSTFISNIGNFTNATYFVWYENDTIFNQTVIALPNINSTNYTLLISNFEFNNYKWNVYACSIIGDCSFAQNNNSFTVSPFSVDAVLYNTSVYETSTQTFSINISANPAVNSVSGLFWYNGSSYTTLITNPSNGKYIATSVIDIPLQNSVGNKSFKWQFDFELTDLSEQQQNTTDYSNEVNRTYIFLCNGTYTSEIINFTTRNAENPFPKVNGTFKSAWQWYLGSGSVFRNISYEDVTETKSDFDFCGLNDSIDYIFTVDIEADATGFSKNFYYFTEAEKTSGNATETDLYLLNDTLSTPTTLLVRDRYQRAIKDVLIFVQLYDVGTDTFYTVTMGKTNQNGEDIVYLNWFDSLYKFIVVQNGTVILTTVPYKVGDTPQIFQIEDDIVYDFDKFRDFQYSLFFNNDTNNFVLTYIKPSGLVESGCLRVINRNATGDTEICETCSTSASATLYCNIGSAGNGTFIATFYATGSLAVIDWIIEEVGIGMSETIFNLLDKDDAAFYTILMSSIVLLIFLISPVFGILGILGGLLLSSAMGFSLISYGSFLFISCVGGTIIWLLRR